jgi:hypothetical protein
MDVDSLYWTNRENLYGLPKSGGTPAILATDSLAGMLGIAADGTYVYWTESYTNEVNRTPKNGGSTLVLASGGGVPGGGSVVEPEALALDASWVYYAGYGIAKVAK